MVMSGWSVYLTTLLLGRFRLSKRLTSTKDKPVLQIVRGNRDNLGIISIFLHRNIHNEIVLMNGFIEK